MKQVRYEKDTSPPYYEWWVWKCLSCRYTNISEDDLSYETEVVCEECGEVFEPL